MGKIMKFISFVFLFVLLILQYIIWFQDGGLHHQYGEAQKKAEQILEENRQLRTEISVMKAEVYDFSNGFEAVSEEARSKLGYIRKGEQFYLSE